MDLNSLVNKIDIKQEKENKPLDTYIENKNREKLETLLSEFLSIINDETAPYLWPAIGVEEYYDYINGKINNFDFNIESIDLSADNLPQYNIIRDNNNENIKFGLFLSALINNAVNGEKTKIKTLIPIDYLFYNLENAEAYVNTAGKYLGKEAKNSRIYADEAKDYPGLYVENCELHVKKANNSLGDNAKNSSIYANEAGNSAGFGMKVCELHVRKAGNYLGNKAEKSKIYAYEVGNRAGWDMQECELHVRKAGEYLGTGAKNSRVYADEAGNGAGKFMQNSKLFIYELKGKLDESCLTGNNEIYLGKESYEKFPEYRGKVKIWEKNTVENALKGVPVDIQDRNKSRY